MPILILYVYRELKYELKELHCHEYLKLQSLLVAYTLRGSGCGLDETIKRNAMQANTEALSSLASLKLAPFTYPGWQEDYQAIIQSQIEDEYFGAALRYGRSNSMTRDRFLGMINKQRLSIGDRSHSHIGMLDSLKGSLTYPGWKKDIEHAERIHTRFPSLFQDQVSFIMKKQSIFEYDKTETEPEKAGKQCYPLLCAASTDSSDSNGSPPKESSCIVCLQAKREYAFVPCGHLCICKDCSVSIANLDGCCPICRCKATHVMRIYT